MRYQAPYGVSDTNASYINGNPAAGIEGSIPPAAAFEQPQREIVNVIQNSDLIPDDADLQQLLKSIRRQYLNFCVDRSANPNTVLVNLTPPLEQYHAGVPLRVVIANTNTGASVINVNQLGPRAIVRTDGSDLHPNDLTAGMIAELCDTGSVMQLQNPVGAPASVSNTYTVDIPYCADTSTTVNQIVAPFLPAITTISEGKFIAVKVKNTNTGAVTIAVNALAPLPVCRDDGSPLQGGDILALETILIENHNTYYQCVGLVRSQVMQPPAPKLRGIIADASGFGAQYIPTSQATLVAYYGVRKNNLQTSTFDGFRLTIGAGEDGVWAIYGSIHQQQGGGANYTEVMILNQTTGVQVAVESSGNLAAGTGNSMSAGAHVLLNVGDVVAVAYYQQGAPVYLQPDTSQRFSAWLISK
jgi:hypothetical protein